MMVVARVPAVVLSATSNRRLAHHTVTLCAVHAAVVVTDGTCQNSVRQQQTRNAVVVMCRVPHVMVRQARIVLSD